MYDFSGIVYRIFGVAGIMFIIGVVCMLIDKPWKNGLNTHCFKTGVIVVVFSICLAGFYVSRIVAKDVYTHTGEFIRTQRDSGSAPPLPLTNKYVFSGDEKNKTFYLDVLSSKKVLPQEFEKGQEYTIYYDRATHVIVKVETKK